MARTIDQIQAAIISDVAAQTDLSYVDNTGATQNITTNTSKRSIWRVWTFVQASAILILEQLQDIFKADLQSKISVAIPGTAQWLNAKVLQFQYSATNPQVVQLVNLIPVYPVVDPSLQIVTRCSVVTTISNQVRVKVAKGTIPGALSNLELSALQSYITTIGVAGVNYVAISSNSDKLYVSGTIYYSGQYSSVIQANVIAAINNYMATLPFNGILKISDLEGVIRTVTGVNDVVLFDVIARKDADALSAGTYLVQSQQLVSRIWPTISGYIVQENTAGKTFADTLTFIPG